MWCCSCDKDPSKIADLNSEQAFTALPTTEDQPTGDRDDDDAEHSFKELAAGIVAREEKADVQSNSPPAGPCSFEFPVVLQKNSGTVLGLELDLSDEVTAHVCLIGAGIIQSYNTQAASELQVKIGDFIVEVNGIRGNSSTFLKLLKEEISTTLVVRRPVEFCVSISKVNRSRKSLGLAFHKAARGISLLVHSIEDGLIKDWNSLHPEMEVKKRDRIVAVNNIRGMNTEKMTRAMEEEDKLELLVVRPTD